MTEVVTRLTVNIDGIQQNLQTYVDAMNKAGAASQSFSASGSQSMDSLTKSVTKLQASTDPVFAATVRQQAAVEAAFKTVNAAVAAGIMTQNQAVTQVGAVNDKYAAQVVAAQNAANAHTVLGRAMSGVSGQLVALAAGAGPVGVFLASLGPWGVAAAVGISAAFNAMNYLTSESDRMGTLAQQMKSFEAVSGLTSDEIQNLNQSAAQFGLTSQDVATFVDRFTVNLTALRTASGPLYTLIRQINPEIANQMLVAKSTAEEINLLALAYQQAGDKGNTLLKDAGGRGAMVDAPLIQNVANAGGVGNLPNNTAGLTQNQIDLFATLKAESDEAGQHVRDNLSQIFAGTVLANMASARQDMEALTGALKNFSPSSSWTSFMNWVDGHTGGLFNVPINGAAAPLGPVAPMPEYPQPLTGLQADKTVDPQANVNTLKAIVAAMGQAKSAANQLATVAIKAAAAPANDNHVVKPKEAHDSGVHRSAA